MASGDRSVDSGISIDHDVVKEINKIFKSNSMYGLYPYTEFILYIRERCYFMITYEKARDDTFIFTYKAPTHLHPITRIRVDPSHLFNITKPEIELLYQMFDLVEIEGWQYSNLVNARHKVYSIYNFPPPEERQKLVDLLKRLFSFPLTKGCK